MKSKLILVSLLFSSATAFAGPHDDLATARERVQAVSTRVSLLELEVTIAERDVATARIVQTTATKQRSRAQVERDDDAASAWERRYAQAVKDEREALDRVVQKRQAHERALEELHTSSARVSKLERGARASR
jgi:hypothetical protein